MNISVNKIAGGLVGLALLAGWGTTHAGSADLVWLEAEKPSYTNLKPNISGWGHPEYLSAGQWLQISIEEDKIGKDLPLEGGLLRYAFVLARAGKHEIWNRIGFEFVRSPFEWRIDQGEWILVSPDELTTDLMEMGFFAEVAWLKLGERDLSIGEHQLEIRLPKLAKGNDKSKFQRVLYASDALVISSESFQPYSRYKPGDDWRTEKDRMAAENVFDMPASARGNERITVRLAGPWEITRDDEQFPAEVAAPMAPLPESPHWTAINVPGDKNTLRHDLIFAHRLWYRTRVIVPTSLAGRSFYLVFPQNNLNTTVYVNGQFCGFDKNPFTRVQIDVSKATRPGTNEFYVGIKDAWYGYSADPRNPLKLRKRFNLPSKFFGDGFQDLAYPIWNHPQSGILVAPELIAAGSVYAADVFVKTSVAQKTICAELTLHNSKKTAANGEIQWQAINAQTGAEEKQFVPGHFNLGPGETQTITLADPWKNPHLWWPDDPALYDLRTTVLVEGQPIDVKQTRFGFREWTSQGIHLMLNGIKWRGWADCFTAPNPQAWIEYYRQTQQKTMRFWGTQWQGLAPEEALDFLDRNGVVVRRSGILDGEAIGYMAIENDAELQRLNKSIIKVELMTNWIDQVVAQVKGERNHPSVNLWSIENEWLYINCINLYGGEMDQFEAWVSKAAQAVKAADPTRFIMTDGGGANKDQSMSLHGNHYVFNSSEPEQYPALAYERNVTGGGRGRWLWDEKRPRFIGEDFFATGINPFDYAYFGGDAAFLGKAEATPAAGLVYRMLTEGYRWAEYAGWQFWLGQESAKNQYGSNPHRAAFVREWDSTFGSGQTVTRTVGLFNDSRFNDPMRFEWSLVVGGRTIIEKADDYLVEPGENRKFQITLPMPEVKGRQAGELKLILKVKGQEVFNDTKAISILDTQAGNPLAVEKLNSRDLLVYDPKGSVKDYLKRRGIAFSEITDLQNLPEEGRILVIGQAALSLRESTSSHLAAWSSSGRRLIVLEQDNPLKYQGLPAEMKAETNVGRTAFIEDSSHTVVMGLKDSDFFTWGNDELVYRNAYEKPMRGAKSLVQCHRRLANSALVEVPVGDGLMMLCQLAVGEKLSGNAVTQQLFLNLLNYAAAYRLEYRSVTAVVEKDSLLAQNLHHIGLTHKLVNDPIMALDAQNAQIILVEASPTNLKQLADHADQVRAFNGAGGYLVLNGLTPDGLESYNKIVGFNHMIRPFGRERVAFPAQRHPLTAGLTTGDIVLRSGERIFGWTADEYVADDMFGYVVDYTDVAPFARFENDFKRLMVNGMFSADAWKYIVNLPVKECRFRLELPQSQNIIAVRWVGNTFYWPATQAEIFFEGANRRELELKPNNDPQDFSINPGQTAKVIQINITRWQEIPGRNAISGLDNIYLYAERPAEFLATVKPLLNIGGMMFYQRAPGGIVLVNLRFKEREAVPENALKKRAILATVLRNLKAPFSGARTLIAGAKLQYQPVDISPYCNQYRNERGWFGDAKFTLAALPSGKQTFAGVPFQIFELETSPVPNAIMLGGRSIPNNPPAEVRGIKIGRKADALFFLQTARLDNRMSASDRKENRKYELFRYVVRYVDGQTAEIPIYSEIDIDDFKQETPRVIPGAQIAWSRPYAGAQDAATVYLKQWSNPRPMTEIASLDMTYGKERRGVPVLLGLTAAIAEPAY